MESGACLGECSIMDVKPPLDETADQLHDRDIHTLRGMFYQRFG